jgi:hypothetical protein
VGLLIAESLLKAAAKARMDVLWNKSGSAQGCTSEAENEELVGVRNYGDCTAAHTTR